MGQVSTVPAMGRLDNSVGAGLILIVEGVELASTLSQYLSTFFSMTQILYDGKTPLVEHLEQTKELVTTRPYIILERLHLTARANQRCTHLGFLEIDMTMKELGAKLILAIDNEESIRLMQHYWSSALPKCMFEENQRITPLLEWIGALPNAIC